MATNTELRALERKAHRRVEVLKIAAMLSPVGTQPKQLLERAEELATWVEAPLLPEPDIPA